MSEKDEGGVSSGVVPRFELTRIYDDGTRSVPRIVPVSALPWDAGMDRRGFLGAGVTAAFVLGATSCVPRRSSNVIRVGGKRSPAWRTAPRRRCGDLDAHAGLLTALTWADGARTLVTAGFDRKVKLWSLPEGALRQTVTVRRAGDAGFAALTPDGATLILGSRSGRVRLVSLREDRLVRVLRGGPRLLGMALGADGKMLAGWSEREVVLRDLPSGTIRHRVALPARTQGVAVNLASRSVVVWASGKLEVHSLDGGAPPRTLPSDLSRVRRLAVDPGGDLLAVAGRRRLELWRLREGVLAATLPAGPRPVRALAFSADGGLLAAAFSREVRVWRVPEGEVVAVLPQAFARRMVFGPAGKALLVGSGRQVARWRLPAGTPEPCLVDLAANHPRRKGRTIRVRTEGGRWVTYTLPCGSPIPAGAICTCNCVRGTLAGGSVRRRYRWRWRRRRRRWRRPWRRRRRRWRGGRRFCTCNQVCTCIPVRR